MAMPLMLLACRKMSTQMLKTMASARRVEMTGRGYAAAVAAAAVDEEEDCRRRRLEAGDADGDGGSSMSASEPAWRSAAGGAMFVGREGCGTEERETSLG